MAAPKNFHSNLRAVYIYIYIDFSPDFVSFCRAPKRRCRRESWKAMDFRHHDADAAAGEGGASATLMLREKKVGVGLGGH